MYLEVRKPAPTLVFEDLGALKFQLGSREKGLDLEHAELVLQRLGQMHAASMVLFDKVKGILARGRHHHRYYIVVHFCVVDARIEGLL